MCSHQYHYAIGWTVLFGLLQPKCCFLKRLLLGDAECDETGGCFIVKVFDNRSESLLSCCIPNLEYDCLLAHFDLIFGKLTAYSGLILRVEFVFKIAGQ